MNEAELAMVVACAHSIKDCAFDLDAEGGAFRLDDLKFALETAAGNRNTWVTHINRPLPFDDVSWHHSVDCSDLVANARSSPRSR